MYSLCFGIIYVINYILVNTVYFCHVMRLGGWTTIACLGLFPCFWPKFLSLLSCKYGFPLFLTLCSSICLFVIIVSWKLKQCAIFNVFLQLMKTIFVRRDLSYNNLSGPVPKSPARTFKYGYCATATVSLWLYYVDDYCIYPDFAFCFTFVLSHLALWETHWFVELVPMKVALDQSLLSLPPPS